MKKLLTILSLIVFSSNSFSETIRQEQLVEKDGLVYKSGSNQPFTGSIMDVYDNFQIMGTGTFKDGKRDGMWISFWKNGNVENEGVFKEGKKHGLFKSFFENGQIRYIQEHKNGVPVGVCKHFDKDGNLIKTEEYKDGEVYKVDGKLDPLWGKFDEEGNLKPKEDWN